MTLDLFAGTDAPTPDGALAAAPEIERFDWYQAFAEHRRSVPPGWRWYKIETLNYQAPRAQQTVKVDGGVAPLKTRGKRAGCPDWKARDKSLDRSIAFTWAEIDQFQRDWEIETSKCFACYGAGQEWAGWSRDAGDKFRHCNRCNATGLAKAEGK